LPSVKGGEVNELRDRDLNTSLKLNFAKFVKLLNLKPITCLPVSGGPLATARRQA
jgi:hypothetical protein